jgi:predicted ATP-dependent Lon-type protease
MIIYNITTKVNNSIAADWMQWLKNIHVKEVMESDCFTEYKIVKLLEIDETDGPTFAVQFFAESKGLYNRYIEKFAGEMRKRSFEKWGDQFISIRTIMQIVD